MRPRAFNLNVSAFLAATLARRGTPRALARDTLARRAFGLPLAAGLPRGFGFP
jgi:hypothetical protein